MLPPRDRDEPARLESAEGRGSIGQCQRRGVVGDRPLTVDEQEYLVLQFRDRDAMAGSGLAEVHGTASGAVYVGHVHAERDGVIETRHELCRVPNGLIEDSLRDS